MMNYDEAGILETFGFSVDMVEPGYESYFYSFDIPGVELSAEINICFIGDKWNEWEHYQSAMVIGESEVKLNHLKTAQEVIDLIALLTVGKSEAAKE